MIRGRLPRPRTGFVATCGRYGSRCVTKSATTSMSYSVNQATMRVSTTKIVIGPMFPGLFLQFTSESIPFHHDVSDGIDTKVTDRHPRSERLQSDQAWP